MITVIDYGVGNLASILNMFEFIGEECQVSSNLDLIRQSDGLVLPGVGAFDHAMQELRASKIVPTLESLVFDRRIPILGICLGMHILGKSSTEGREQGLGWLNAHCERLEIPKDSRLKVPNNGWRNIVPSIDSRLFRDLDLPARYYFNHSYYMIPKQDECSAVFDYSGTRCCSVESGNIYGVQFHPEKSHSFGMSLFSKFASICNEADDA